MEQIPLVSIVIPTYNRCEYLKETLLTIFDQTYQNFEVIVISDMSSDQTSDMISGLNDERISLYQLESKSSGPGFVRNYGVSKAKGSLIAFCDDDDLWEADKLQKQVAVMHTDPQIAIVATNVSYFGAVKKQFLFFSKIKSLLNKLHFISKKYLLALYNCLVISSTMVRRSVLIEYKFDESKEYQGHEDLDLWIRICRSKKAFVISESLTNYRVHSDQLSTFLNEDYKRQSLKILKKRWSDFDAFQKIIFMIRISVYKVFKY